MDAVEGAFRDIVDGFRLAPLWSRLGWEQTVARFRRTVLGPFWLTANLLAISFSLNFIFGTMATFPMLIAGIMTWTLLGGVLAEASGIFMASSGLMQTMKLPLSFHVLLMMHRTFINFLAQLLAFWAVLAVMRLIALPSWQILVGLPLVLANMCLMSIIVAVPSTRFRDINQTVQFLVQMLFFLTPVMWTPTSPKDFRLVLVNNNPLAHLLELVRQPLLGHAPTLANWEWGFGTLLAQFVIVIVLLVLFRKRIVFWL
jgi:ABC-2 type transport system permease protein